LRQTTRPLTSGNAGGGLVRAELRDANFTMWSVAVGRR
jgi:hypothetical protein